MEGMALSPQESSVYSPDTGSSSEHSESESTGGDLSTRRNALNQFLLVSGVEFVTQSKKKFG